nr:MAG TPA: hypothetical protein [Caudoviricetes sp.]
MFLADKHRSYRTIRGCNIASAQRCLLVLFGCKNPDISHLLFPLHLPFLHIPSPQV